jgi:hypothetical protein
MAGMDKLCSLHDAVARDIQNGMSVAMGCGLESLIPFAASHEIIRQRKPDLPPLLDSRHVFTIPVYGIAAILLAVPIIRGENYV